MLRAALPLVRPLRRQAPALFAAAAWSGLLALSTTAYGLLAGPVLRVVFGGELHLPGPLAALGAALTPSALATSLPVAAVLTAALKGLASRQQALATAAVGLGVASEVRATAFGALLRAPADRIEQLGAGDALVRLLDDVDRVEQVAVAGVSALARDALQVVSLVVTAFWLSPGLAALFFCVYPLAIGPLAVLGRRMRRQAGEAAGERGAMATELHQSLRGLSLLQVHRAEGWAESRLRAVEERLHAARLRGLRIRSTTSPMMELLGAVALAVTVVYARQAVASGSLSGEAVLSFLATVLLLYAPVKSLVRAPEVWLPGLASLDRLAALERLGPPEPSERPRAKAIADGPVRSLAWSALTVSRAGRVALQAPPAALQGGQIAALIGDNGTGKSTLLLALLGALRPASGEIVIDGRALPGLDLGAWRSRLAWVPQAPSLRRGTLRENLCLGREDLDEATLRAAVVDAGLGELFASGRLTWDTVLDDDGAGLSGGEQRRLALARALARRPDVLLLDEPEAHLDAEAVGALAAALPRLAAERIVVLATHEPALIRCAHVVVALAPGEPPCSPIASAG